jgi:hypothetical protein
LGALTARNVAEHLTGKREEGMQRAKVVERKCHVCSTCCTFFSRVVVSYQDKNIVFFGQILTKFEFSRQIFEKYSNIKFHQNPSNGKPSRSMRTDGHDEANSRFSQFCERA